MQGPTLARPHLVFHVTPQGRDGAQTADAFEGWWSQWGYTKGLMSNFQAPGTRSKDTESGQVLICMGN